MVLTRSLAAKIASNDLIESSIKNKQDCKPVKSAKGCRPVKFAKQYTRAKKQNIYPHHVRSLHSSSTNAENSEKMFTIAMSNYIDYGDDHPSWNDWISIIYTSLYHTSST